MPRAQNLRRSVQRRPDLRHRRVEVDPSTLATVPDLAHIVLGDQDVARLEIAVDDRSRERVHVRERPSAAPENLEPDRRRKSALPVRRGEVTERAELKHDPHLARVLDLEEAQDPDNVGMTQLEDELDLPAGLLRIELVKELDRHGLLFERSAEDLGRRAL